MELPAEETEPVFLNLPELPPIDDKKWRRDKDTQFLLALNDICQTLKRVEANLVKGRDDEELFEQSQKNTQSGLEISEFDKERIRDKRYIIDKYPWEKVTTYYRISKSTASKLLEEETHQRGESRYSALNVPPEMIVEDFPEMVSDSSWKYYQPIWEDQIQCSTYDCELDTGSNGRSNFTASWNFPALSSNFPPLSAQIYENDYENDIEDFEHTLYIPYSSMPDIHLPGFYLRPRFSETEISKMNKLFDGLWMLPSDSRLAFNFQVPALMSIKDKEPHAFIEHIGNLRGLQDKHIQCGGSFEVVDIDSHGEYFRYSTSHCVFPTVAEELFLQIPPRRFQFRGTTFLNYEEKLTANWRRIVTIRGLAEVYTSPTWEVTDETSEGNKRLLRFHSSCIVKIHERSSQSSRVFHIGWMDIRNEKLPRATQPANPAWQRQDLRGCQDKKSIGMASGSLRICVDMYDTERWTLLVLAPTKIIGESPQLSSADLRATSPANSTVWGPTLKTVLHFMHMAYYWWGQIADHLEDLINMGDVEALFSKDQDSKTQDVFWVISKSDEILPMISDATEQWEWFKKTNKLTVDAGDVMDGSGLISKGYHWAAGGGSREIPEEEKKQLLLVRRKDIEEIITEIDKVREHLEASRERFVAIRDRARTLSDGLFSLINLNEARTSRILGENVKLLTYVTIFFLPLAFCTSMWAINDMFGTKTKGFAIITTVLSLITYALVFSLMHPTTQAQAIQWAKQRLLMLSPSTLFPKKNSSGATTVSKSGKQNQGSEGGEKNASASGLEEGGKRHWKVILRAMLGLKEAKKNDSEAARVEELTNISLN